MSLKIKEMKFKHVCLPLIALLIFAGCEFPLSEFIKNESISGSDMQQTLGPQMPEPQLRHIMKGELTQAVNTAVSPPKTSCSNIHLPLTPETNGQRPSVNSPHSSAANHEDFFSQLTKAPPKKCGYKLSGFSRRDVNKICQAMNEVIEDRQVRCHDSNCATASWLAILKILKTRDDWEQLRPQFTCQAPFPRTYLVYVNHGIRGLAKEYKLGPTARMNLSGNSSQKSQQLKANIQKGWPQKGDPLLLQRNASRSYTGHAVIFSHFKTSTGKVYDKSNAEDITEVCYWSSNRSTNGSSSRCEKISYMQHIDAARINGNG